MGKGRKAVPTALKKLAGNPGKRKYNDREPVVSVSKEVPSAPDFLDSVGKEEWARSGKLLHDAGVLTDVDLTAFGSYCQSYSDFIHAVDGLKKSGHIIRDPENEKKFKINPWRRVLIESQANMKQLLSEFGMTPASRSKVKTEQTDPDEDFDAFLNSGGPKLVKGGK
jgi:P27 family predicted phage terminase small subunit